MILMKSQSSLLLLYVHLYKKHLVCKLSLFGFLRPEILRNLESDKGLDYMNIPSAGMWNIMIWLLPGGGVESEYTPSTTQVQICTAHSNCGKALVTWPQHKNTFAGYDSQFWHNPYNRKISSNQGVRTSDRLGASETGR